MSAVGRPLKSWFEREDRGADPAGTGAWVSEDKPWVPCTPARGPTNCPARSTPGWEGSSLPSALPTHPCAGLSWDSLTLRTTRPG